MDWDIFHDALLDPPSPNTALRRAMRRYRECFGECAAAWYQAPSARTGSVRPYSCELVLDSDMLVSLPRRSAARRVNLRRVGCSAPLVSSPFELVGELVDIGDMTNSVVPEPG